MVTMPEVTWGAGGGLLRKKKREREWYLAFTHENRFISSPLHRVRDVCLMGFQIYLHICEVFNPKTNQQVASERGSQ